MHQADDATDPWGGRWWSDVEPSFWDNAYRLEAPGDAEAVKFPDYPVKLTKPKRHRAASAFPNRDVHELLIPGLRLAIGEAI